MIVKLLTEHHLEFLSLSGGCRGSSKSTLVKISKCWKSHVAAHLLAHSQGRSGLPCEFDADLWRPIPNQTLGDN